MRQLGVTLQEAIAQARRHYDKCYRCQNGLLCATGAQLYQKTMFPPDQYRQAERKKH